MPEHVRRRATPLDEVQLVRSVPRGAPTTVRPSGEGGIAWRPGVPHIIIHSGDTTGACPYPVDYEITEYVEPASPEGLPVPLATQRTYATTGQDFHQLVWFPPDDTHPYGYWDADLVDYAPEFFHYYDRHGRVGEPWVAPSNGATLPGALEALAELDIALVGISYVLENYQDETKTEWSYADLIQYYEESGQFGPASLSSEELAGLPDTWGGTDHYGITSVGLAFLTNATLPDDDGVERAMAYGWEEDSAAGRWVEPTPSDATSYSTFLVSQILRLADKLGNGSKFDIALCVDSSGSFSGADSLVQRIFKDIIDSLRDAELDIWVGVSRYEEYGYYSFPYGGESYDGRPFILQYPLAPVVDEEDYQSMIAALADDPPGGGGDTPETYIEAFYQIATGAGFAGTYDLPDGFDSPTETDRSGEPGVRGIPIEIVSIEANYFLADVVGWMMSAFGWSEAEVQDWFDKYNDAPQFSEGFGYMWPGSSGDVPAFGHGKGPRGVANDTGQVTRVWTYAG